MARARLRAAPELDRERRDRRRIRCGLQTHPQSNRDAAARRSAGQRALPLRHRQRGRAPRPDCHHDHRRRVRRRDPLPRLHVRTARQTPRHEPAREDRDRGDHDDPVRGRALPRSGHPGRRAGGVHGARVRRDLRGDRRAVHADGRARHVRRRRARADLLESRGEGNFVAMNLLPLLLVLAQQQPLAGLDPYITQAIKDWRVPGLAIVVVKDDSVVFIKGYGVRELGKPDPVTVHTRFGNMSTTKAFTAMLVAMLADSGRVAFDDPVTKYEPAVQFADPYVTREIAVRDLLTHRVGFGDPDYLWGTSGLDFATIRRRLRLVPATTSFRSRFQYNNVTYALAGDVAARAAGTTWQTLLHARILGPLGMTETVADASELRTAGITDVTAPHGIVRDTVRVLPAPLDGIDDIAPAGSILSTATDMAKWLRFLLDSGRVSGRRLVSAQNFATLFRPQQIVQRPFYPTATLTHPHFQADGLGWILQDYRGEFIAIHTGSIAGRPAIVGLIPDLRLGVAIFTNLDHSELRHALTYTVFDRFIGAASPAHDWSVEMRAMYKRIADSTRAARQARESKRVPNTQPTLPLERYTGTYADSLYGTATVGLVNGRLTLQAGTASGQLEHWQYDLFRVTWPDPFWEAAYVSFAIDPDGSVGELRVVDGGSYRRVK